MVKKYGRNMVVGKDDLKYKERFSDFVSIICELSIIGEKKLCEHCDHAMRLWEEEQKVEFWELFKYFGKKKNDGISRFLQIFRSEIDSRHYTESDYDDIIETMEVGIEATFKNELGKVFPRLPEIS